MADIYQEKAALAREQLYTTVFSQCFSPCGKFLAACSNFGKISIFSLTSALSPEATEDAWNSFYTFQAQDGPAYCLTSADRFLISANGSCIKAWNWGDVLSKTAKVAWTVEIPQTVDRFSNPEINSLVTYTKDGGLRLLAGCGDNLIHMWDVGPGKHMTSFHGHTDYIHCVTVRPSGQQFLSASEDGTVQLWAFQLTDKHWAALASYSGMHSIQNSDPDVRDGKQSVHLVEPHKHEECARPYLGKWIRTVAVDSADDWMVCGGGPRLCLWHLRSMAATTVFDTPNVPVNHAMFYDDSIISAGSEPFVHHWAINGDRRAQVPCSPTNVFSVVINDRSASSKVLAVAGNCNKIDICTNFGYKAFSLSFC